MIPLLLWGGSALVASGLGYFGYRKLMPKKIEDERTTYYDVDPAQQVVDAVGNQQTSYTAPTPTTSPMTSKSKMSQIAQIRLQQIRNKQIK